MRRSQIQIMPQFFDRYINLVDSETDLIRGLEDGMNYFDEDAETLRSIGDIRYAPGKWTPKDILQHIIDNERVQSYRALRIMRNDPTALPGYDEELFGNHTTAVGRSIEDLLGEYKVVRQATLYLFRNSTEEMLQRSAVCSNSLISALALGFMLIGHVIHHDKVLKERYYVLG